MSTASSFLLSYSGPNLPHVRCLKSSRMWNSSPVFSILRSSIWSLLKSRFCTVSRHYLKTYRSWNKPIWMSVLYILLKSREAKTKLKSSSTLASMLQVNEFDRISKISLYSWRNQYSRTKKKERKQTSHHYLYWIFSLQAFWVLPGKEFEVKGEQ